MFAKRDGVLICNECGSGARSRADWRALTYNAVDGILCNAAPIARDLRRHYHPTAPIRVLPHFTCLGLNVPARRDYIVSNRPFSISFLGRLDSGKNPEMLIDLWPSLGFSPAMLNFYGDGPLRPALCARIHERNLAGEVFVHGGYDNKRDLTRIMLETDLLVLPSSSEGLPLVLLEALAHGVPFVTTDTGGCSVLAQDNPFVRVVPLDSAVIRNAIRELYGQIVSGQFSPAWLQDIYRRRYGPEVVCRAWRKAMFEPRRFFNIRRS